MVGLVVHAVAEAIARGDVARDQREIGPFVDEIWASVPFPAHYQRLHERQRVDEMITALLAWEAVDRTLRGRHRADLQPPRARDVTAGPGHRLDRSC